MVLNYPEKRKQLLWKKLKRQGGGKIAPVTVWVARNLSIEFSVQKKIFLRRILLLERGNIQVSAYFSKSDVTLYNRTFLTGMFLNNMFLGNHNETDTSPSAM